MGGSWQEGANVPAPLPRSLQELFYEDRHFHEGCFRCCRCQRSLADEPFTCQDSELLCNDCYCSAFSSQCSACGETVMPGMFPGARSVWDWHAWHLCGIHACVWDWHACLICTGRLDKELAMPHVPGNCVQDLLCLFALWSSARARTDMRDTHLGA